MIEFNAWREVIDRSFQDLWDLVIGFLPNLVVAVLILILGWLIGAILGKVVYQVLKAIKVEDGLRSAGVEDFLHRGGIVMSPAKFLGSLVKWFVVAVFLVAVFETLKLHQVTGFIKDQVLGFLVNVIIAVLILVVAAVVADFVKKIIVASAETAQIKISGFLGSLVQWSIWIFALLIAVAQLGVAQEFMQTLFTAIVFAMAIALGIAFGLGGKETASRYIEKVERDIASK